MLRHSVRKPYISYFFFALFFATVFIRCASIAQPTGGPRDSLPPLIVFTDPPQRTLNFTEQKIVLHFNEYIQVRDQQKEFLVSPVMEQKPMLTVKGRSLEIEFEEPLEPDMTYRLDFGNSIADNNEGNKLGNYAFVFSTGPALDTLMMSGIVIDAFTRDTVMDALVFFYFAELDTDPLKDSTVFNTQARAVFRTDSAGLFLADILQDRPYRVYALLDKNGNQKYEAGTDFIGFLDSTYNPVDMPDFAMWIEAAHGRIGPRRRIEPPQLRLEVFQEDAARRQTILGSSRPSRQQLQIIFNSKEAEILSFQVQGMDSTWLIRENGYKGDTVWYWIAPPTAQDVAALRDTIRAEITYVSQDSIWQPIVRTDNLTLVHRISQPGVKSRSAVADSIAQAKKEVKRQKRLAKLQKKWLKKARKISRKRGDGRLPDSVLLKDSTLFQQIKIDTTLREKEELLPPPNPFGYKVTASNPLNPEKHISFSFAYPLRKIDTDRIELGKVVSSSPGTVDVRNIRNRPREEEVPAEDQVKETIPIPFRLVEDSLRKNVRLEADWEENEEYSLLIPDSVFINIAFEANDTLPSTFTVADPSRYGELEVSLGAEESYPDSEYIIEIMTSQGRSVERIPHAIAGEKYLIRFLSPGEYRIKITEDRNGNGIWDTGSLVNRQQPEKIRIWSQGELGSDILVRENWTVPAEIDLPDLFSQP